MEGELEGRSKRGKWVSAVVSALDQVLAPVGVPKELLQLIDEFGPNCWRSLTSEFLLKFTKDYLEEWEPTAFDVKIFHLALLAESARDEMEKQISIWSNQTWSTQAIRAQFQLWLNQSEDDYNQDTFTHQLRTSHFWRYYPIFRKLDEFSEINSKGEHLAECEEETFQLNLEYHSKLICYAFDLSPRICD